MGDRKHSSIIVSDGGIIALLGGIIALLTITFDAVTALLVIMSNSTPLYGESSLLCCCV